MSTITPIKPVRRQRTKALAPMHRLIVRLEPDLHAWAARYAFDHRISLSSWLATLLEAERQRLMQPGPVPALKEGV